MSELPSRLLRALKIVLCMIGRGAPIKNFVHLWIWPGDASYCCLFFFFFSSFLDDNSFGREAGFDGWGTPSSGRSWEITVLCFLLLIRQWINIVFLGEKVSIIITFLEGFHEGSLEESHLHYLARILKVEKAFICLIYFERGVVKDWFCLRGFHLAALRSPFSSLPDRLEFRFLWVDLVQIYILGLSLLGKW